MKKFVGSGESSITPANRVWVSIEVFNFEITEEKIITDNRSIDYVVEEIAKRNGVTLLPDKRVFMKKKTLLNITYLSIVTHYF